MAKKPSTAVVEIAPVASANVRTEEFDATQRELAAWMRLDISASPDARAERAIQAYNAATQHMVEAGLLLASVRQDVGPEAFQKVLEERGMAKERAYELMRGARLVARLAPDQREQVMALHKTKVALLANASANVVEAALSDDEIDLDTLSVRGLREKIRELEAAHTDLQVQRDTAEAEAEGLKKKLKRGLPERADQVPHEVADLRAEIMALGRKADLALDSFGPLGSELVIMGNSAHTDWADATIRLAVAQLAAVRMQVEGMLAKFVKLLPGEDPAPAPRSKLTKQEVAETARLFSELAQTHTYEAALREWQREQERPRSKGRPKDKPVAPGSAS